MTAPNGTPVDGHIDIDELADSAEGLLSPDRDARIATHLSGCEQCRESAAALAEVQDLLRTAPVETMPDAVFARLQHTLAAEQVQRESDPAETADRPKTGAGRDQPGIGGGSRFTKQHLAEHFTDTLTSPRGLRARFAGGAIAATLIAGTVGFGGYVISASAGTDEPPAERQLVVNDSQLTPAVTEEVRQGDLNPHHFSRAWRCAKRVTDGDISGIRSTMVDGRSGYLVFLPGDGETKVVFITGCETGTPTVETTVDVRKP